MKHLNDEQLSGLLDGALTGRARAAAAAHLEGCEACRSRLAELAALDQDLGRSLAHDPGDAYFADFAERVQRRIAAAPRPSPAASATASTKSGIRWLLSPRGLALAGSTAALLATAGLAWLRFHEEDDGARVLREAMPGHRSSTDAGSRTAFGLSAPGAPAAKAPPASSTPAQPTPPLPSPAGRAPAARAQEVRTLPNGEAEPVSPYLPSRGEPGSERLNEREAGPRSPLAAPASDLARIKRRALTSAKDETADRAGAAPPAAASAEAAPPAPAGEVAREKAQSSATEESRSPAREVPADKLTRSAGGRDEKRTESVRPEPQMAAPAIPAPATLQSKPADTTTRKPGHVWGALKNLFSGPPPAAPPAPASGAASGVAAAPEATRQQPMRALGLDGRADESATLDRAAAGALPPCGSVRDSRGEPLAGAELTIVHDGVRTARSGPDGRFCFDALRSGDTVSVLRVGFAPLRVVVGPRSSLALVMDPVGTLGSEVRGRFAKGGGPPRLARPAGEMAFADSPDAHDPYVEEPESIRAAVFALRESTSVARREGSATRLVRASEQWAALARRLSGPAAYDARFQALWMLRDAYRTEPTPARASRLKQELAAYLASSPRSPGSDREKGHREEALRWQSELENRWGRPASTYR